LRYFRQQAAQHSWAGSQHPPPLQQALIFPFVLTESQHAWGGLQQSPSGQQLVAFALAALARQHACGGLQHSAFGAQQFIFAPDTPPPRIPKSRAKGASSFKVMTDLHWIEC
jgi:hypothetical protein